MNYHAELLRRARPFLWNGKDVLRWDEQRQTICMSVAVAAERWQIESPREAAAIRKAHGDLSVELTRRCGWNVRHWLFANWKQLPKDLKRLLKPHGYCIESRNDLRTEGVQAYRLAFLEELIREKAAQPVDSAGDQAA